MNITVLTDAYVNEVENVFKVRGEQKRYRFEMEIGLEATNIGTNESIYKINILHSKWY
jgi:hypothetical protein